MNEEQKLFQSGCFLPNWQEDVEPQVQTPIQNAYSMQNKSVEELTSELTKIRERISQIRERQWELDKMMNFHNHNFAKE